ncbi:hypothetical protein [Ensifer sp. SL37]|uniref:hypothetical protein n=1 Tax=Ensifer sp. SL37 TaxID=2995137 RepID=UPI00227482DE|nr:hypothetical protein [Ensifer sp. SL37]MCY1740495.1 hypothetical protein [Ensifer sp. SL37]
MSISLTLYNQHSTTASAQGLNGLGDRLAESLRSQEEGIVGSIKGALDPSGPLMSLPKPVLEQFRKWDQQFTDPDQIKMIETVKHKILELHAERREVVRSEVESKADRLRLDLSLKAISKTMAGVQQLLAAQ